MKHHHAWALVALMLLAGHAGQPQAGSSYTPGTLANPGFEGQPMKSVYFYAGQWRFPGDAFYEGPVPGVRVRPARNDCKYTMFPKDGNTHLGWSENNHPEKRQHAVNLMLAAGVNVVNMSYWGPPNTDRWMFWAPMQTATRAHDELFDVVVGKPVLIAPYIENSRATFGLPEGGCFGDTGTGQVGQSPGYNFLEAFPGTPDNPAPQLVEQIVDLVTRYLLQPRNAEWPKKWAQMFDRDGKPRHVVALIHVGSNQPGVTDETFAQGFGWVADRVYALTGVLVGFTLDALPPEHNARFKPSPTQTGPLLAQQPAVLAIQPFNPEVYTGRCAAGEGCDAVFGSPTLDELIAWKRQFVSGWVDTGIPVILDVTPGYDAHKVFDNSRRYGNNDAWHNGQANFVSLGVRGITGNTWNGYTEGYAIVPSCRAADGPPGLPACDSIIGIDRTYRWFQTLSVPGGMEARLPATLVRTSVPSGVYSDPITLTFRLTSFDLATALLRIPDPVPLANKEVRVRLGNQEAQGTTDPNGVVTVTVTLNQQPGHVPLVARFAGDSQYLSIEALGSIGVAKETTNVQWLPEVGPTGVAGPAVTLAARLADDDGQPVSKRTIVFVVGPGPKVEMCSALTEADGVARCKLAVSRSPGARTVSMDFAGDAFYDPATAQREVDLNPGCPFSDKAVCPD